MLKIKFNLEFMQRDFHSVAAHMGVLRSSDLVYQWRHARENRSIAYWLLHDGYSPGDEMIRLIDAFRGIAR